MSKFTGESRAFGLDSCLPYLSFQLEIKFSYSSHPLPPPLLFQKDLSPHPFSPLLLVSKAVVMARIWKIWSLLIFLTAGISGPSR